MQIAFHLGAPHTDNDQLIWSLREDRHALAEAGVVVPRPRAYRARMSKVTPALRGASLSPEEQRDLLAEFGVGPEDLRVVLSDPKFICSPKKIWFEGEFYGKAGFKTAWLRQTFEGHEVEFFLAIRNPAAFLSDLLKAQSPMTLSDHLQGANPGAMFWSEVIRMIVDENPGAPVTVWCNEDTPVIWPLVLAAVAGVEPDTPLAGGDKIARPLLTPEGQASLSESIGNPITADMLHTLSALEHHMAAYVNGAALDEEIDIPDWENHHVAAVTKAYEDDFARIAAIPGVTFIRP